ncbi:MAG: chromate transporter [Eubacteriales bacterium]
MSMSLIFCKFFQIGLFGFGGGLAMLPFIFQAAQQISDMGAQEFSNLVVISQITPGPLAVNAATYVGYSAMGFSGAIVATFGVCSPSFFLVIFISKMINRCKESKLYFAVMQGIRPAAAGLVAAGGAMICKTALFDEQAIEKIKKMLLSGASHFDFIKYIEVFNLFECAVFAISMVLILKFKMSAIRLMIVIAICIFAISFI